MVTRIQALGIDLCGADGPARTIPDQTAAAHRARAWKTNRIENRWRDVKQAGGFVHTVVRKALEARRPMDDEGHMKSALVNEIAVGALAMFSQTLSMIGGENDQRLFEKLAMLQECQKIPQNPVLVSQFSRITSLAMAQARILRQIVR